MFKKAGCDSTRNEAVVDVDGVEEVVAAAAAAGAQPPADQIHLQTYSSFQTGYWNGPWLGDDVNEGGEDASCRCGCCCCCWRSSQTFATLGSTWTL